MAKLSIRVQLSLAFALSFGLLLASWSAALYRLFATRVYSQVDAQIESRAAVLRPLFNVSRGKLYWLSDPADFERSASLAYAVFDARGVVLEGSNLARVLVFPFTEAAREALEKRSIIWEIFTVPPEHRIRALNLPITGSDGEFYLLRVAMPLDQTEEDLRQLSATLGVLVPLVIFIGGVAAWGMAGRALQPVVEITSMARRITARSLHERLPLRGTGDELDQLSATLNEMVGRLQNSFEQMGQFLSNVSHELRTPLAALRGSCEIALRTGSKPEAAYRQLLERNIEELERLSRTVADLLVLARAEAGQLPLRRKPQNVAELVRDAVESMHPLAAERKIVMEHRADGEVSAEVDAEYFLRLVLNLLDNAIKYNKPQGTVQVSLARTDSGVLLEVRDTGCGIPESDMPYVFNRFFRSRDESAHSAGGTGLGLSLARWVAQAHGGRIEVESMLGQGSTFRVWLPLAAPESTAPGADSLDGSVFVPTEP